MDAWRPSLGYIAMALASVAGGLAVLLMSSPSQTSAAAGTSPAATSSVAASNAAPEAPGHTAAAASGPAPAAAAATAGPAPATRLSATAEARRIPRMREPDSDQTPDLSDYVNDGEVPTMAEVIERLHLAGVHSGLGAFSPPGTRPPLIGLAVPEDFVLPEGYVRHYQATDDGQRIEPILMFSPDVPFVDATGAPIAIPQDRVVPPELAPPGLPIRRNAIPAPIEPGRPGR